MLSVIAVASPLPINVAIAVTGVVVVAWTAMVWGKLFLRPELLPLPSKLLPLLRLSGMDVAAREA